MFECLAKPGKPATLCAAGTGAAGEARRLPTRLWVLRDQDGSIFLHELLLGSLFELAPLAESLPARSDAQRLAALEPETAKAYADRFAELVAGARLILTEAERAEAFAEMHNIPHALDDVFMTSDKGAGEALGGYRTMAAVERRTRYLPLGLRSSALYSGSTPLERATRASAQSNRLVQKEDSTLLHAKGGTITAPKKEKMRGLREFTETCVCFAVPEETATVAVQTASAVYESMKRAETAMVVNGWGLFELQSLWNEMLALGTRSWSDEFPSSSAHQRLSQHMQLLVEGGVKLAGGTEAAALLGEAAKVGDKRRGGAAESKDMKSSRARRAHDIPLDDNGRPLLPLQLGASMTILCLGTVKPPPNPNFHTDKYIWPVGYKCTRQYYSTIDPNSKCDYACEILGGERPLFKITPGDDPSHSEVAQTASGVWSAIMKRVNSNRVSRGFGESKTAVSGPEYFGLAYPEIKRLIQELPGASLCATKPMGKGCYKWQDFGDGPLTGPTLSVPSASRAVLRPTVSPTVTEASIDSKKDLGPEGGEAQLGRKREHEEAAWDDLERLNEARQAGGREAVGLDAGMHDLANMRTQGEVAVDRRKLLDKFAADSVYRLYWASWLQDPSNAAAPLEQYYDQSVHTAR